MLQHLRYPAESCHWPLLCFSAIYQLVVWTNHALLHGKPESEAAVHYALTSHVDPAAAPRKSHRVALGTVVIAVVVGDYWCDVPTGLLLCW